MSPALRSFVALLAFLALTFSAAAAGARFMPGEWYAQLSKPSWNPPSWIFGPAWTFLYACMAVAAWLVWRKQGLAGAATPIWNKAKKMLAYSHSIVAGGLPEMS